jgi:MoaA/NifB/PqqE/SkfB family radical SAM enzyme
MNNLREQFLKGEKPSGCASCWESEAVGKTSKRLVSLQKFSNHVDKFDQDIQLPIYLDLKLGTVCNLKCRSCSSHSSFKWANDEKKLYGYTLNKTLKSYWIDDDSDFWVDIEEILPHIEHFDFTGGEPFLIKKHFDILKKCVDQGYAKNITVHYNTNGTVDTTEKMFKIWKEFKNVEIMFSADGIEDKFEYLRNPGKWNNFVKIFESTLDQPNIYVNICYSVSIFNVLYMYEFINWFNTYNLPEDRLYFNLIWQPEYLSIKNLSFDTKEKIKTFLNNNQFENKNLNNRVNEVIDFMFTDGKNLETNFVEITKRIDKIRNENFTKTFKELSDILKC